MFRSAVIAVAIISPLDLRTIRTHLLENRPVQPLSTRKLGFFFSDHHRWLLQHIRRRVRNPADAEDTAADTFCQMLAARVDPDSIEQPRAYLSTIARRLIFDRHRRGKLESAYLERLALLPETVVPSPEEQLQLIEALVAIDRADADDLRAGMSGSGSIDGGWAPLGWQVVRPAIRWVRLKLWI